MRLLPPYIRHLGVQNLHALSQLRCRSPEEFRGPTSPPKHRNPCRGKRALVCQTLPCTLLLWSVLSVDTEPASRADVTVLSVDKEHHEQVSLCCQLTQSQHHEQMSLCCQLTQSQDHEQMSLCCQLTQSHHHEQMSLCCQLIQSITSRCHCAVS